MKSVEHSSKKRFLVKAKCGSKLDRKKKKKGCDNKKRYRKKKEIRLFFKFFAVTRSIDLSFGRTRRFRDIQGGREIHVPSLFIQSLWDFNAREVTNPRVPESFNMASLKSCLEHSCIYAKNKIPTSSNRSFLRFVPLNPKKEEEEKNAHWLSISSNVY